MKRAKEELLKEIDRVAAVVPSDRDIYRYFTGFHTFKVQGTNCVYRIRNTREAMTEFKKLVKAHILKSPVKGRRPKKQRKVNPETALRVRGVAYYGDFRPRRRPIYEASGQTMVTGKIFDDIFSAAGYAILVGPGFRPKKPVNEGIYGRENQDGKWEYLDSPPYEKMLALFNGEVSKAEIIGEMGLPYEGEPVCIHVMTDSGLEFFYDTKYVDPILTLYPDAEITVNISNSRAIFIQGNIRVGVIAPMDINVLPPEVQPLYEALHPVKLPDRAVGF